MKILGSLVDARHRLDLVAGLSDGMLTALTLGAGHMLPASTPVSPGLALRVACAAALSGAFVFFVAHYAERRGELVEAERQLNLTSHGQLATSRLGRAVMREAAIQAAIASGCTFCGALLPLVVGTWIQQPRWLGAVVALAALCLLGYFLARTVYGSPFRWMTGLVLGGVALTLMGAWLDIA
jgi:predicted membrane protein (TIGR00267 family)